MASHREKSSQQAVGEGKILDSPQERENQHHENIGTPNVQNKGYLRTDDSSRKTQERKSSLVEMGIHYQYDERTVDCMNSNCQPYRGIHAIDGYRKNSTGNGKYK